MQGEDVWSTLDIVSEQSRQMPHPLPGGRIPYTEPLILFGLVLTILFTLTHYGGILVLFHHPMLRSTGSRMRGVGEGLKARNAIYMP